MLNQQISSARAKESWQAIEGSSQELAISCPAHTILYHGARGPGKTDCQLMRFHMRVGQGYGPFWRGVIFDREYKNLDDIITKSKRWFYGFNNGVRFLEGTSNYRWIWPTGEELLFRTVKREADYWDYHGQEFPYIGWNELCKFPSPDLFDMMLSCNRSSWTREKNAPLDAEGIPVEMANIPLEVFATANPYGPGHGWVKRRFIDRAQDGDLVFDAVDVFDPRTQKRRQVVRSQVAIFGSYKENPYLDPIYVANLEKEKDPNRRKAWLEGDWNIVAGGAFDDVYSRSIHEIPAFEIPANWRVDRAFDWGSSKPFAVIWFAESNGEEVTLASGAKRSFPRGTLFAIDELYGSKELGDNQGVKWGSPKVAQEIIRKEWLMRANGFIHTDVMPGPADNQIRDVREKDVETIEIKMSKEGVRWERSDKSPGSRKVGLELTRNRFEASLHGERPGLYFFDNCVFLKGLVPMLPRDPEEMDDVDSEAEDHLWDALRYRVLKSANRIAMDLKVRFPT